MAWRSCKDIACKWKTVSGISEINYVACLKSLAICMVGSKN